MAHVTQITRIAGKEYHTYSDDRTEERTSSNTCKCNNKKLSTNKPVEQQEKLFPPTLADGSKNPELNTQRKAKEDDPRSGDGKEMLTPCGIELEDK